MIWKNVSTTDLKNKKVNTSNVRYWNNVTIKQTNRKLSVVVWVVISLFKNLVLCSSCINNCWHPSMSVSICAEVKNTFRNVYLLKHIYVYLHINVSQMRTVWPMCGNPRTAVWTAPREDRLCGDWSRDPILWSVSVLCSC